ncbi:MAG: transporter [Epsilonproteobacteria bacterium]|nr:MAG: transporter [Campylobacterota bacterium]
MKVLNASLTLSLLFSLSILNAEESNLPVAESKAQSLETYLSELKRKQFGYDYEKVEQDSNKLRDSWIQPVKLQYSFNRQDMFNELGAPSTDSQTAAIIIDQPIFQSGGLIYGVQFANASREYSNYSVEQQQRILIKNAVELLMKIKQADFGIEKQALQIANSEINLEQKREQYLHGQLDSGFLNNAIIEKNIVIQTMYDLETAKQRLVSQFENISDMNYKMANIPFLAMIDEEKFLKDNIDIQLAISDVEKNRLNKNVTLTKYLPAVSLQGSYNWQKNESFFFINGTPQKSDSPETSYFKYGFRATLPLDINSYNDYESARISYLKSQIVIDDKKRELKSLFEQVMQNLENFDKKITLSEENRQLYKTLLDETRDLYSAGYKTVYDVATLENSEKIQVINKHIFEIDKQLELLNLYEKLMNEV